MYATFIPESSAPGATGRGGAVRLAFLLLFPGFFFYQMLIGLGAVPAFLGGYFAIVSIALFVPLAFSYYMAVKAAGYRVPRTDLEFGFFLAYFLAVVAVNACFGANPIIDQTHLASILYFFNIYVIFRTADFSRPQTQRAALAALLVMTAIIFYYSTDGLFRGGMEGDPQSPENVASYQGFARSYLMTLVPVIAFTTRAPVRIFLYFIAVPALFLNSSRSELIAALMLIPLVEVYRARSGLHILCFLLLSIAALPVVVQVAAHAMPDSRVWELFDLKSSNSANVRQGLASQALHTIAEHPLMGNYASYVPGEYAHNILSAWVDLGLFGFVYMLYMLLPTAVRLALASVRLRERSGHFLLAWTLICIALLLLFTAKTFDDMVAGAALGAYANWRSSKAAATGGEGAGADD